MRVAIVCAVAALACVALVSQGVAGRPFDMRRHRGALNHRLTQEQMNEYNEAIQPQWFNQTLDHENIVGTATFPQQYLVNDTFWNPNAPLIFLMIGGEGPISPAYVNGHFIISSLAQQYGALQVALEHRFYGQSVPSGDSSTSHLQYLSSDQALEDLVTFHAFLEGKYGKAKWIVFGGSYSGSLSAWARLKYPQLFLGSYAASAPVQAELDFFQYFDVVAASVGPNTTAVLAAAQQQVNALLATPKGVQKLTQDFELCAPPQTERDTATFLSAITDPIAETVQYNDDANRRSFDITTIQTIMSATADPYTALVNLWNAYNVHTNNTQCTDISYANMIAEMQSTSDGRSWTWQTCTEFGYYQTAEDSTQPFNSQISLPYYLNQCADIFQVPGLAPDVEYINDFYGGNQIVTSNTVFIDGTIDPWHILGNYQTYQPGSGSFTLLITGTAHCADLYSPQPDDLPALTAARAEANAQIALWLMAPNPLETEEAKSTVEKATEKIVLKEF